MSTSSSGFSMSSTESPLPVYTFGAGTVVVGAAVVVVVGSVVVVVGPSVVSVSVVEDAVVSVSSARVVSVTAVSTVPSSSPTARRDTTIIRPTTIKPMTTMATLTNLLCLLHQLAVSFFSAMMLPLPSHAPCEAMRLTPVTYHGWGIAETGFYTAPRPRDSSLISSRRAAACSKPVSYTHLRAHETKANLVCRLL